MSSSLPAFYHADCVQNLELVLWTTQGVLFKAGYKDPKQRWWTESSIMLAAEVRSKTLVRERVTPDSDKTFWDPTLFTPNLQIAVRKQLEDWAIELREEYGFTFEKVKQVSWNLLLYSLCCESEGQAGYSVSQ